MKTIIKQSLTPEAIQQLLTSLGKVTLLEAAIGCRVSGGNPPDCAPIIFKNYPDATVEQMADALTTAWAAAIDKNLLTKALKACNFPENQITEAVQQAISLFYQQDAQYVDNNGMNKATGLYQGDLTHMKAVSEIVDYLVISSLPNDYSATAGSMIGALNDIGVSVAALAENKAADYRSSDYCWISQPISNQAFKRIICFEATQSGDGVAKQVPGIFTSLQTFAGTEAQNIIVATSMVSTGSNGASPTTILTALFNGSKTLLNSDFSLMAFEIVNFNTDWINPLNELFAQLTQS
ncbi:glycerol-3-phosphate dehydrogenase/oxidase [Chitinophaga flava]|uniref:Uncharacterized protein n=1 Tax=Chitinophaga flava TaxID=2259036 RepID=A0A365XXT8_9BACT|nr:glycerol-3-phosphate dehydrogenase/oxidase [Chitinophaga flava]RBL90524.1 hypothetical protein DF182_29140 [Chitinophaga flava]